MLWLITATNKLAIGPCSKRPRPIAEHCKWPMISTSRDWCHFSMFWTHSARFTQPRAIWLRAKRTWHRILWRFTKRWAVVGKPTETDRPEGVKFVLAACHALDEAYRKRPDRRRDKCTSA